MAATGRHVGNIYLRNIDWTARHGELHIFIADKARRGRGYGSSALRQLIRHAFDTLGLQRIYLFVLKDNRAAVRAYEKCGFVVEGSLRRHAFKGGRFKDMLIMGLLREKSRR